MHVKGGRWYIIALYFDVIFGKRVLITFFLSGNCLLAGLIRCYLYKRVDKRIESYYLCCLIRGTAYLNCKCEVADRPAKINKDPEWHVDSVTVLDMNNLLETLNVSESTVKKLANALFLQLGEEGISLQENLINHFLEKGYERAEIKTSKDVNISSHYHTGNLVLKAEADGVTKSVELNDYHQTIKLFELSSDNLKITNEILKGFREKLDAWKASEIKKSEKLFLSIKKAPRSITSITGIGFNMQDHGVTGVSANTLNISLPHNIIIKPTEVMMKHFNALLAEFQQEKEKEKALEAQKKAEAEAARQKAINELLTWAKEKGSELLNLRIQHKQNWQNLAETEWALAHTTGFSLYEDLVNEDCVEEYPVKNATIEQLQMLEKAKDENPDADIIIERHAYDDTISGRFHKTFLWAYVPTPLSSINLYQEIADTYEDDSE